MTRQTRKARKAQIKEQLSRAMRQSRLALFIQQFEKEAQERMNELHTRLEDMLATVDKVFKVAAFIFPLTAQERMNELNTRLEDMLATVDKVFKVAAFIFPFTAQERMNELHTRLEDMLATVDKVFKVAAFIFPFTAQERMNELNTRLEDMLATVDKVFKVALMKMPPSPQKTRIGDLISEETSASEVTIAMKNESLEMQQPLRRAHSKRVKSTDSSPGQSTPTHRSSSKVSKGGKGTKRTRTLVGSKSSDNLRGSSVTTKRTQSCLTKTNDQTVPVKPKLRSVVSTGDLHCSVAGAAAHITVTTAQGQTVCLCEETKDDINLDVLDDVAWCQIQKLTSLMDYLSRRSRCQR